MGALVLGVGIFMMVYGFGGGATGTGILGIVVTIIGAGLFWRTSATKAYLDQNKRR